MVKSSLKEKYRIIFGYVGIILIITGVSLMVPLTLIPFLPYKNNEVLIFSLLSIGTIIFGIGLKRLLKGANINGLSIKEGAVIVTISWICSIIIGALPFVLNKTLTYTQAVFESVSGFTTTGLSVIDVTNATPMILLWRTIMQFLGGVGLAVIMLSAIIGPLGVGIYNAEGRIDKLVPNVKKSTKLIMTIYCSYILGGIFLYLVCGMPIFDAINHSIAAVSTGGFSTRVESIGYYNSVSIELVTIILMLLGTINFAAHSILWKGKVKDFFKISEIRFMGVLLLIFIPLTLFITTIGIFKSFSKSLRVAIFEIISAVSTTGFSTVSYLNWNSFGFFILIILMFIGGGSGSTAGGIKQYRIHVLLKTFYWNIKEVFLPKRTIKINKLTKPEGEILIEESDIKEITTLLTVYFLFFIISVLILLSYGYDIKDAMFEISSCLSTIGLSSGITSIDLPKGILWTMSTAMLMGRLEFLIIFYAIVKIYKDIQFKFYKRNKL